MSRPRKTAKANGNSTPTVETEKREEVSSTSSLLHNPAGIGSQPVQLSLIDYDWKWNLSRQFVDDEHRARALEEFKNSDEFKNLLYSLREKGQLTNVVIRPIPGNEGAAKPFRMVAGFCRALAFEILGKNGDKRWSAINATITTQDERTCDQLNVIENAVRNDMSRFQIANAAFLYREKHHVTSDELGKHFAFTADYMRNLVRCRENLHHDILVAWADRNPEKNAAYASATVSDKLNMYAGMAPENQLAEFHKQVLLAMNPTMTEAEAENAVKAKGFAFGPKRMGGKGKGKGNKKGKLLSRETVMIAYESVTAGMEEAEDPDDRRVYKAVERALAFVLQLDGARKIIVDRMKVFDPEEREKEHEEEAAEAIKAAEEAQERAKELKAQAMKAKAALAKSGRGAQA